MLVLLVLVVLLLVAILITLLNVWHSVGVFFVVVVSLVALITVASLLSKAMGGGEVATLIIIFIPFIALVIWGIYMQATGKMDKHGNLHTNPKRKKEKTTFSDF